MATAEDFAKAIKAKLDLKANSTDLDAKADKTAVLTKPSNPTSTKMLTQDSSGNIALADIPAAGQATTVTVAAGGDINAACASAGVGAIIKLSAGKYPITSAIAPLKGQTIDGPREAIIYGGRTVTGWTVSGSNWVATVSSLPSSGDNNSGAQCELTSVGTNCSLPEQVWINGVHQQRVFSTPVSAGQAYIDYSAKTVTVGTNPTSATVEISVTQRAITSNAYGVTLRGFTVDCFANPAQSGAIEAGGASATDMVTGCHWNIVGVKGTRCHGAGAKLSQSHNSTISQCEFSYNGQLGISGWMCQNILLWNNRLEGNNTDGFYTHDWEAGGIKVTNGTSGSICDNVSISNEGIGIWSDGWEGGWTYGLDIGNNTVVDNASCGIRYEISPPGRIHDNYVARNGFRISRPTDISPWATAGINIQTVMSAQVYNNTSVGNRHGFTVQWRNRSDAPSTLGQVLVTGNRFDISNSSAALIGAVCENSANTSAFKANIKFGHNTYVLAGGSTSSSQFYESGVGSGGNHTASDWYSSVGIDTCLKLETPTVIGAST